MANGTTDTGDLIRKLSRRQWRVSFAVVFLALGLLLTGWLLIANNGEDAENINLAGRQRMLSQRMTMYLALQQREPDAEKQRQYRVMAATAATEFEQAHARLAAIAGTHDADSAIRSLYFGPAGNVDAESRRYLFRVREAIEAAVQGKPGDARKTEAIVAAAGSSLIRELDAVTALHQHADEQKEALMIRLLLISTLLMVSLVAFGMFRVFRPLIRRLAGDVAARDRAESDRKESEERFKAFSESSSDWFWQTDAQHRFNWTLDGRNVQAPLPL